MPFTSHRSWCRSAIAILCWNALMYFSLVSARAQPVQRDAGNRSASIPTENLKLWLRADAGVVVTETGVSYWADQSGSGTEAVQFEPGSRPTLFSGAINGKPSVSFDGIDDFMSFTLPVNGLTAMTLVLVSAAAQ